MRTALACCGNWVDSMNAATIGHRFCSAGWKRGGSGEDHRSLVTLGRSFREFGSVVKICRVAGSRCPGIPDPCERVGRELVSTAVVGSMLG